MSDNSIKKYYEKIYLSKSRTLKNNIKRVRNNLRLFPISASDKILDIGCGFGTNVLYLSSKGAKVVGIDISHEAAKISSKLSSIGTLQSDAQILPFKDNSFNKATFMGTLEHFPNPIESLKEAKRVLVKDATVCIMVPNSDFPLFKYLGGTGQIYEVPHTYNEWVKMLEENEFRIIEEYKDPGPGFFDRGIAGIFKKLLLIAFNMLPIKYTYQFVFICKT